MVGWPDGCAHCSQNSRGASLPVYVHGTKRRKLNSKGPSATAAATAAATSTTIVTEVLILDIVEEVDPSIHLLIFSQ